MPNYDASQVGVPYRRAHKITIEYTTDAMVNATIEQIEAVKLADGTVGKLADDGVLKHQFALPADYSVTFPMVNPTSGENLGQDTNLQNVFLHFLAAVRYIQRIYQG